MPQEGIREPAGEGGCAEATVLIIGARARPHARAEISARHQAKQQRDQEALAMSR